MDIKIIKYIPFFLVPFALGLIFTPIVRIIAIKIGLVSHPRTDRWHKHPTALLGGTGIYLAAVFSALLLGLTSKGAIGLFLGATFLFLVGLLDDAFHFTPYIKLFTQIIASSIAVLFGVIIGLPFNIFLAIPLTLLWLIGITNAFNLLDNIDGLAVGIAAISSLMLFFSSLIYSNNPLGIFGLILAGAALGFLPYNLNPAKIFMGDSGSMFLGYSLAVISIAGTTQHISKLLITMIIPVLILSVPIFDTIFVIIARKLQGKRIFEGGKDHTSHRLITLGLSPRKTVLLLYVISIIFGSIAFLYLHISLFVIFAIAFLAIVVLLIFGIFLFEVTSDTKRGEFFQSKNKSRNNYIILNNIFLHKRRIVEVLLDFIFICLAYYSAYFLRFENPLLTKNLSLLQESLIWIILIKMSVFFMLGLYRGVWRYMGISDFITMFKVVSVGSVTSILFLTFAFRFRDYSRAVFFIDWLLLLLLITGSRFLFRIIGEFFSRIQNGEKKILIFGAGDTGEMVIREIKRNKSLHYNPVGFIDDDPYKVGNKIHGVPILGSRDKIKNLVQLYNIQELIIATASLDAQSLSEITLICKDCGITYRKVKGIMDE
jgi:UDP-GlcNAc:undecaprenyl-phosphate GlcNAc-1-phosphate transferase